MMKTATKYILAVMMSLPFSAVIASAQTSTPGFSPEGVELKKIVTLGSEPNTYTIDLEAFVTGSSIKTEGILEPIDYSLVLDTSGSMSEFVGFGYTAMENRKYTYPELADGYTSLFTWKDATSAPSYNVSYNGESWTGYSTKYAIKVGNIYKHVLLCTSSGSYIAVAGTIGENTVSDVQALTSSGDKYNSFSSGKTSAIQLYQAAQSGTKLKLLKDAVNSFLEIVSNHAKENNLDHMVSLIRYNSDSKTNGTSTSDYTGTSKEGAVVIKNFKLLNESGTTNFDILKAGSNSLSTWGQTYPYHGVELVKELYDKQTVSGVLVKNNKHKKVVVLFSDGEPGSSGFNKTNANKTINDLYTLKHTYGATVFTVGIFSNVDDKCHQYMNASSQNYPDATEYTHAVKNGSADITAHDFYRLVGIHSLEDIFKQIAEETTSGGASYDLNKQSTTVIDVVSPAFRLPEGASADLISLKVAPCSGVQPTGVDGKYIYSFGDPVLIGKNGTLFKDVVAKIGDLTKTTVGDIVTVTFTEKAGGKTVQVSNFDFSENWVGPREGEIPPYGGYKLIISFPIEIDPANPGGANVATNSEDSGVYTDKGDGSGYQQIGGFEIPHAKIPNLIVLKYGLHKGESATYNVINKDTNELYPIVLVATQKSDDPNTPCISRVKIQKPGRYEVVESSWSWAYELSERVGVYTVDDTDCGSVPVETWNELGYGDAASGYQAQIPTVFGTVLPDGKTSIIRNVNDFTEDPEYSGTLFIFKNTIKTGTPAHAEAIKNNEFYKAK